MFRSRVNSREADIRWQVQKRVFNDGGKEVSGSK